MILKYKDLNGNEKQVEIPDGACNIHVEFGGWYSPYGVYLWFNFQGIDKCKKLSGTKQHTNLRYFENQFKSPNLNSKTNQ